MAFRALLFSKSPEANNALLTACKNAGVRVDVCTEIFSAIEKATKQSFSCVLPDWTDQPEAGFLLKRARESAQNAGIIAIALVDVEPTAADMRDNRLDFLIYRPVGIEEASEVLIKAKEKMQSVAAGAVDSAPETVATSTSEPEPAANAIEQPQHQQQQDPEPVFQDTVTMADDGESEDQPRSPLFANLSFPVRPVIAVVLALAAAFFLWRAHDTVTYLARTREGRFHVLRESVAALFYMSPTGATPLVAAGSDAQQDAYFSRGAETSTAPATQIGVVSTEAQLSESRIQLPKALDFPLPTPVYDPPPATPIHVQHAAIPDSLRGSSPIPPPVVVAVTPAQMMPVSAPVLAPIPQQVAEPVSVSEETERALLIHSVDPVYPNEAVPQKLKGPVVLLATIGRSGSVEDLKIVRGYFILGKAAIAAVKQWRFQPYMLNGRPAQTLTTITVNFSNPG